MSLSVDAWKEADAELDFQLDHLSSLTEDDFANSWWKTDGQGLDVRLHPSPAAEPHQPLGLPRGESQALPPHNLGSLSDSPLNGSPHLNLLNALPLECNDSSIFFADTPPLDQTPSTSQSSPASRNPLPLECNDDSSVFFADTQLLDQTPSASQSSPTSRIPATPIGLILSDDRYSCHSNICAGLTFSRIADLKRHHNTVHSTSPTRFWCAWKGCSRSDGGKPFPRKDKRDEHVRKKHLKTTNIRRHL